MDNRPIVEAAKVRRQVRNELVVGLLKKKIKPVVKRKSRAKKEVELVVKEEDEPVEELPEPEPKSKPKRKKSSYLD